MSNKESYKFHHYLKITDDSIDVFKKPVYIGSLLLMHLLYFLLFFGIVIVNSEYLNYLNIFIQTSIALFLMYRFFPFRTYYLREFDPQIIFACGFFLFLNTFVVEFTRAHPFLA